MKIDIVRGEDGWRKQYLKPQNRRIIWIHIKLSNGHIVFLSKYEYWLEFAEYLKLNKLRIEEIGLRHKTHTITQNCTGYEAVYLVRSVRGQFGGATKQCYTIGLINGNKVEKTMWLTPELVQEDSYTDDIENCFIEGIVQNTNGQTKTI